MKSTEELRKQDINTNMVSKTVLKLSIALAVFATVVVVTIANWFLYNNIQSEARQAVHADIQLVSSKDQARQQ
ncbi:hypothetical protein AB0280_17620 [Pseudarthrobacter sp902506025]|uniref:hypothetical protein n=1 Tax=Pseudarthrobacter sp. 902506025 TaxID=3155291 RepID=UPI00344E977B